MTKAEKSMVLEIKAQIKENKQFTVAAILRVFQMQTATEQSSNMTVVDNGVGFNGRDAEIGSSFAKQILNWIRDKQEGKPLRYDFPLSPRQLQVAQRFMPKYAAQIMSFGFDDNTYISKIWAKIESERLAS